MYDIKCKYQNIKLIKENIKKKFKVTNYFLLKKKF